MYIKNKGFLFNIYPFDNLNDNIKYRQYRT